jgi:NACalpha-BTF3-like transcription factor
MPIVVKNALAETATFELGSDCPVGTLRAMIRDHFTLPPDSPCVLYLDSFALDDSWTVGQLDLSADSVIYVRVQHRSVALPRATRPPANASKSDLPSAAEADIAFLQEFASSDRATAVAALERARGDRERALWSLLDAPAAHAPPKEPPTAALRREFPQLEAAIVEIVLEQVGGDAAKARAALRGMCSQ